MKARAFVRAGVCGFETTIVASSEDSQHVRFDIDSTCENIKKVAAGLPLVEGYQEISQGFDGVIYSRAREVLKGCCAGCAVPPAIFKSMQVAAALALPAAVSIDIEKDG